MTLRFIPKLQSFWPLLLATLAWACLAPAAKAHDPLDHTTTMIIYDDHIEVSVVLGLDIARPFFQATHTNVSAGPNPTAKLPVAVADQLVELKAGDQQLPAQAFSGIYGMQEVTFLVVYPRPREGALTVRLAFLNLFPDMRPGSFGAVDGLRNPLKTAVLSTDAPSLQIPLPLPGAGASSNTSSPFEQTTPAPVATPSLSHSK